MSDNRDVSHPSQASDNGSGTHQIVFPRPSRYREIVRDPIVNSMILYNNQCDISNGDTVQFYKVRPPIGFALLLGSDRTPKEPDPLPVEQDINLMKNTLSKRGWIVSNPSADHRLTLSDCNLCLESLARNDFSKYSCFMFYYSGHGISEGLLLSDESCKPYKDIVTHISSIKSLEDKPKIFIFDSCRTHLSRKRESQANSISVPYPFNKGIEKVYVESKTHNYPPSHSLICFSACEGMPGHSYELGSFYTIQFCRKMCSFGKSMTVPEILILTNGGTTAEAEGQKMKQQPVWYCTLNRLLLLNGDAPRDENTVYQTCDDTPMDIGSISQKNEARKKGPYFTKQEGNLDIEVDAVRKGPLPGSKFKTKQEVITNLPKLGQGLSIFICYVPNPGTPYYDPQNCTAEITRNKILITHLIHDLERHGFNVISDLHLGDVQPKNWLQWYVSRIDLCDYLIMVCSPSFKELFSCEKPKFPIKDERISRFVCYRQAMYAHIEREVRESPNGSRFIPVILDDQWPVEDCVPLLFAMATTYQLHTGSSREFVYDEMYGHFERLVCRMAGINRMEIDKLADQGIQPLAAPYASKPVGRNNSPLDRKPRRGYKTVPSKLVQPSGHDQQTLGGGWGAQPRIGGGQPYVPVAHQHRSSGPPHPYRLDQRQHASLQQNLGPIHNGLTNTQRPMDTPPVPSQPVQVPGPSSLPDKPPEHAVILWLCDRITNWRFIARYLEIRDSEIERISIDNRDHGVIEQRYQMFVSWKRLESREYSYHTLGEVLLKSADNKGLYPEFYQKVMEIEQRMQTD